MRVLIANSEPGFRGGENQTLALGKELIARGSIVAVAVRRSSPLSDLCSKLGCVCLQLPFEKIPILTPLALARFIRSWQPDILHAQTADAHTHLWFARAFCRSAAPLVVSRRVEFALKRFPLLALKYKIGVAHFVPISIAAARTLSAIGIPDSKMTIIPSGVETRRFCGLRDPDIREELGIEAGDFVIGTAAAFEKEKGLHVLIEASSILVKRGENVRVILFGEGSLRSKLKSEVKQMNLEGIFLFLRPGLPLERLLGAFDIFVLPSLEEGLSTALLAAMAYGLPIVASRTGGIPEALADDSGILVPPGDPEKLAEAIFSLMHDPLKREKLGERAKARASSFDISRTADAILAVYNALLRGSKEDESGERISTI